ncbi:hypothetical protein B5X24_HaOG204457 [Helicoverpa armigera]|uniref:Uncharacterized protein n=1 Tax=Helicoverpa armigera TaxID=29058 RepID=A0A2W1BNM6_HELAM|nr:hypothetical protein B5X24_HaOG204457 [Helicoverpa armigera]
MCIIFYFYIVIIFVELQLVNSAPFHNQSNNSVSNIGDLKPSWLQLSESTHTDSINSTNKIKQINSKGSSTNSSCEEHDYEKNLSKEATLKNLDEDLTEPPSNLKSKTIRGSVKDKTKEIIIDAVHALVLMQTTGYETNESQISAPIHSTDSSTRSNVIMESVQLSNLSFVNHLSHKLTTQNVMKQENASFVVLSSSTKEPTVKNNQSSSSMISPTYKTTMSKQQENVKIVSKNVRRTDPLQSSRKAAHGQAARRPNIHVLQRIIHTISTRPFYPGGITPKGPKVPVVILKCGKARCLELEWSDHEETVVKPPKEDKNDKNKIDPKDKVQFRVSHATGYTISPNELLTDDVLESKSLILDM